MNEKAFQKYLATGEYVPTEDAAPLTDLQKHDRRFHPNGFDPKQGKCKFREALAEGDIVDNVDQDKEDYSGGPKKYLLYLKRTAGQAPDISHLQSAIHDCERALGEEIDAVEVEPLKKSGRDLVYQATVFVKKGAQPPSEERVIEKLNNLSGSYGNKFDVEFVSQVEIEPGKKADIEREESSKKKSGAAKPQKHKDETPDSYVPLHARNSTSEVAEFAIDNGLVKARADEEIEDVSAPDDNGDLEITLSSDDGSGRTVVLPLKAIRKSLNVNAYWEKDPYSGNEAFLIVPD